MLHLLNLNPPVFIDMHKGQCSESPLGMTMKNNNTDRIQRLQLSLTVQRADMITSALKAIPVTVQERIGTGAVFRAAMRLETLRGTISRGSQGSTWMSVDG